MGNQAMIVIPSEARNLTVGARNLRGRIFARQLMEVLRSAQDDREVQGYCNSVPTRLTQTPLHG